MASAAAAAAGKQLEKVEGAVKETAALLLDLGTGEAATEAEVAAEDIPASSLAQDAYGVGMLCAVQGFDACKFSESRTERCSGVLMVMWGVFVLLLNIALQFFLMYFSRQYVMEPMVDDVQDLYAEYHEVSFNDTEWSLDLWHQWDRDQRVTLCQLPLGAPNFFLTVLLLWSLAMTGELRLSIRLFLDILQLPTPPEGKACIRSFERGEGIVVFMRNTIKVFVVAFVIIPKVATSIVLWYIGCRWLTSTPAFSDLILNSCALFFVVQIDEMIYSGLIPEAIQLQIERTSIYTSRLHKEEVTRVWKTIDPWNYIRSLNWFAVAVCSTYLYIFKFQRVLPNFQWDIHTACEHLKM